MKKGDLACAGRFDAGERARQDGAVGICFRAAGPRRAHTGAEYWAARRRRRTSASDARRPSDARRSVAAAGLVEIGDREIVDDRERVGSARRKVYVRARRGRGRKEYPLACNESAAGCVNVRQLFRHEKEILAESDNASQAHVRSGSESEAKAQKSSTSAGAWIRSSATGRRQTKFLRRIAETISGSSIASNSARRAFQRVVVGKAQALGRQLRRHLLEEFWSARGGCSQLR